jgi:hypothetical protein
MRKNLGTADKAVRIIAGIVLIALFATNVISGPIAIFLLILASIFIITSFVSFCPFYFPFGISTRKKGNRLGNRQGFQL